MTDQLDYQALNEQVEKGVRRQKGALRGVYLVLSIFMFILFSVIAASIAAGNLDAGLPLGLMGMGWLTTLIFFGLSAFADYGGFDKALRTQVMSKLISQQVLERTQAEMAGMYEKPKREEGAVDRLRDEAQDAPAMELTDDGELIPARQQKNDGVGA